MRKPNARQLQGREPCAWDESQVLFHLNTNQKNVVVRPLAAYAAANHEARLAPKQDLEDAPASARGQRQSPIAGTYGLRTPRGKITLVACAGCRRRKSKCDGARPECNTCRSRSLTCVYDVAGNAKTIIRLRACVRQLTKELDDMKSVVSLLAAAPDRGSAGNWASELEKNGFAHHSAEEVKEALSSRDNIDDATSRLDYFARGRPRSCSSYEWVLANESIEDDDDPHVRSRARSQTSRNVLPLESHWNRIGIAPGSCPTHSNGLTTGKIVDYVIHFEPSSSARDIVSSLLGMSTDSTNRVGYEGLRARPFAISIKTKTEVQIVEEAKVARINALMRQLAALGVKNPAAEA
ncbi:bzip transcription factor protein [Alternaria alternata]|nr:bzip transcription factor protein [Alternaria alternata]